MDEVSRNAFKAIFNEEFASNLQRVSQPVCTSAGDLLLVVVDHLLLVVVDHLLLVVVVVVRV